MEAILNGMRISAVFGFILFSSAMAALADPVPEAEIQSQHKSCVESCTNAGAPADRCESFCFCADDEVRKNFTLDEYKRMYQAMAANAKQPNLPPDLQAKVTHLVQSCAKR